MLCVVSWMRSVSFPNTSSAPLLLLIRIFPPVPSLKGTYAPSVLYSMSSPSSSLPSGPHFSLSPVCPASSNAFLPLIVPPASSTNSTFKFLLSSFLEIASSTFLVFSLPFNILSDFSPVNKSFLVRV